MNATDVNTVVDKVAGLLEKVADKLGVAANKVWPWLVKQQYVEGATPLIALGICTAASVFSYTRLVKYMSFSTDRKNGEDWDAHKARKANIEAFQMIWGGVLALTFAGGILALLCSMGGIQQLINPEYFALMDLVKAAK